MMETLPIPDAAKRASRSDRTIRNWLKDGLVDAVRDAEGKRVVVVVSLDAYLATLNATPVPQQEGLPELVAELGKLREMLDQRDREIRSLEWRNGDLSGKLELERQKLRLLEAGPAVVAKVEGLPEPLPGPMQALPEALPEVETWGQRVKRWFTG